MDYVLAFFLTSLFGLWGWDLGFVNFADDQHIFREIFLLFVVILALHALLNIFSSPLSRCSTASRSGGTCSGC